MEQLPLAERLAFFHSAQEVINELEYAAMDDDEFYSVYLDCWQRWSARVLCRLIEILCLPHTTANSTPHVEVLEQRVALSMMIGWLAGCLGEHGHDGRMDTVLERLCRVNELRLATLRQAIQSQIISRLGLEEEKEEGSERSPSEKLSEKSQSETFENLSQSERESARSRKRWIMTGVGATVGGTLMAVSAGLAAPIVLPSLALLFGLSAGTAALLAGTGAAALTGLLFGAAGAGLAGFKMNRRWGLISDFSFLPLHPSHSLTVDLVISGWLEHEDDTWRPWLISRDSRRWDGSMDHNERWALQWEKKVLLSLGSALSRFIASSAASTATTTLIAQTTLSAAMGAMLFPLTVLQLGDLIDNPWSMAMDRAQQAGELLAREIVLKRVHGHRPLNLYGFSLGSIVILSCLDTLIRMATSESDPMAEQEVFGLIGHVILLGTPRCFDPEQWRRYRWLVGGRLIHGYSRRDWVLSFLYRSTTAAFQNNGIVGLMPLEVEGVESIDLSDCVRGHLDYLARLPEILSLLCI